MWEVWVSVWMQNWFAAEGKETPSNTLQLSVKIRPLLRKFQVGLWPHDPPSPTGPIIEYTQTHTTHAHTNSRRAGGSPVVRRHWWRVLDGIISPAVLSHPWRREAHLPLDWVLFFFFHTVLNPSACCFYFLEGYEAYWTQVSYKSQLGADSLSLLLGCSWCECALFIHLICRVTVTRS